MIHVLPHNGHATLPDHSCVKLWFVGLIGLDVEQSKLPPCAEINELGTIENFITIKENYLARLLCIQVSSYSIFNNNGHDSTEKTNMANDFN